LDTLAIVFSRWLILWEKFKTKNDKLSIIGIEVMVRVNTADELDRMQLT